MDEIKSVLKNAQVIPEYWVKESTKNHISVESGFGRDSGYGYQWWVYTNLPVNAYKAWGGLRKHSVMIIIIPDLDAVKSIMPLSPNPEVANELKNFIGNTLN